MIIITIINQTTKDGIFSGSIEREHWPEKD